MCMSPQEVEKVQAVSLLSPSLLSPFNPISLFSTSLYIHKNSFTFPFFSIFFLNLISRLSTTLPALHFALSPVNAAFSTFSPLLQSHFHTFSAGTDWNAELLLLLSHPCYRLFVVFFFNDWSFYIFPQEKKKKKKKNPSSLTEQVLPDLFWFLSGTSSNQQQKGGEEMGKREKQSEDRRPNGGHHSHTAPHRWFI